MTSTDETRFFFPAWGISLTLHGAAVGLAFAFAAQVKPVLQENYSSGTWRWWKRRSRNRYRIKCRQPCLQNRHRRRSLSQPRPKRATEVSQAVKPLERKIEPPPPMIEPVQTIEQKVENSQPREEPIEQRIVERRKLNQRPSRS